MLHDTVQDVRLKLLLLGSGGALWRRLGDRKRQIKTWKHPGPFPCCIGGQTQILNSTNTLTQLSLASVRLWFDDSAAHLQQKVDDGRLLAGRRHAQVVHDQDPHEVEDVLLGRVVGQGRLGAHVAVFRLTSVHSRVASERFELLDGRTRFVVQIGDLEWTEGGRETFKNINLDVSLFLVLHGG